jgi:radical SAM protein
MSLLQTYIQKTREQRYVLRTGRDGDKRLGRESTYKALDAPTPGARISDRLSSSPILLFWETTKVCPLRCRHCRAKSISTPPSDGLNTAEAMDLLQQVKEFDPYLPTLILTGGDPLSRSDIWEILDEAGRLDLRVALSPAVSERLGVDTVHKIRDANVRSVSTSIDGLADTHDNIRRQSGHFLQTLRAIELLTSAGVKVQINSTVMKTNLHELPEIFSIVAESGASIWEVFFLIQIGRATKTLELSPHETEDVSRFLFDASAYGVIVRTVEAPMYRRIAYQLSHINDDSPRPTTGALYRELKEQLVQRLGNPPKSQVFKPSYARDGKGILFISNTGSIYPSGFTPYELGNIRRNNLKEVYRTNPVLLQIRQGEFDGPCGRCLYNDLCGGSRARALSYYRNVFASDSACMYAKGLVVEHKELFVS